MIFVTVGTHEDPFDRLVERADTLAAKYDVVVQTGTATVRPSRARAVAYLSFDEMLEYMRAAEVVITHAGVGSIMSSLGAGKKPIVVPRLAAHGEHVDDHQLELAWRLAAAGLVDLVDDLEYLGEAVERHERKPTTDLLGPTPLAEEISDYLDGLIPAKTVGL